MFIVVFGFFTFILLFVYVFIAGLLVFISSCLTGKCFWFNSNGEFECMVFVATISFCI